MIWCESAMVPRRAFTCCRLSPPRETSEASGVRNSATGEDEGSAEGLIDSCPPVL